MFNEKKEKEDIQYVTIWVRTHGKWGGKVERNRDTNLQNKTLES